MASVLPSFAFIFSSLSLNSVPFCLVWRLLSIDYINPSLTNCIASGGRAGMCQFSLIDITAGIHSELSVPLPYQLSKILTVIHPLPYTICTGYIFRFSSITVFLLNHSLQLYFGFPKLKMNKVQWTFIVFTCPAWIDPVLVTIPDFVWGSSFSISVHEVPVEPTPSQTHVPDLAC